MIPAVRLFLIFSCLFFSSMQTFAGTAQPNILIVLTDDVGLLNIGAYHRGLMSSRTPNIDRIAKEGMLFTDYYAQPTCTAGRSALITGQLPVRNGLHTVGLPGDPIGLNPDTPTLPELLKELGYRTGQFGKNHLGDRDEFLPRCTDLKNSGGGFITSMPWSTLPTQSFLRAKKVRSLPPETSSILGQLLTENKRS